MTSLDERVEEAAETLLDKLDKGHLQWSENAAIVGVYEDEKRPAKFSGTQVCHAGLSSLTGSIRVVSALMSGEGYATGRVLGKEVELWFVDYILNRSPYAETFVTKDAQQALEQKYTVSRGDVPANLMSAGMVALRRLWEYTYVAAAAYSLAKAGVNEDLAFLLGHTVCTADAPHAASNTSWSGCHSGHCSINPCCMGWKAVKAFMAHKPTQPKGLYCKDTSYDGYDAMFGKVVHGQEDYCKFVNQQFPYEKCKGQAGPNLNPFTKALSQNKGNQVPYDKAIEVMAEWANTTLTEKINNA